MGKLAIALRNLENLLKQKLAGKLDEAGWNQKRLNICERRFWQKASIFMVVSGNFVIVSNSYECKSYKKMQQQR